MAQAEKIPPPEIPRELERPTRFHARLLAEELTQTGEGGAQRLAGALCEARVDLNPHQVEAAAFALDSLPRGGCLLADEVGLGKTIEAGIVLAQLMAEGKRRLLVLCPATLRAQWQAELWDKFELPATIVDGRATRGVGNPFELAVPVIASIPFAAGKAELLASLKWDLVVIDEAHRLRNAHRPTHKTGRALKAALNGRPKLLLTATPLQNELGELYGLLSLLDEQLLGPEHAFKSRYAADGEGALSPSAARELKQRLAPAVQRTLRRQVREYVRFTNRRGLVEDFAPTAPEQDLYEKVSDYLCRAEAQAIEPGKRTLLTLVYRKLLASSSYAIAPTLAKLADSLERRLGQGQGSLFEPDELLGYSEEAEEWGDEAPRPVSEKQLRAEVFELRAYAEQAARIRLNAKGEALKRALDRVFTVARAHLWPEKAVVFTESRRTQEYLLQLLSEHGFAGRITLLCGDAATPEERGALVEEFRERTQILLSTEAGAEGLNLQFCNLVVNYDLPWNPQRIEQRIGRCHRYGQQRDVLVLNFLNRQNAADARLYELLEKKLNLFDGVFGASDEILGALESGVDFERRVLDIYQSCRLPAEIDAAFEALRLDLERRIDRKITETRSLLLERFDGEVRRRLKLKGDQAREAVARRKRSARALIGSTDRAELAKAALALRSSPPEPVSYLRLDCSTLPSRLAHLAGREGWWFAYRFETSGLLPEEKLIHLLLLREGESFQPLTLPDGEAFLDLGAALEPTRKPPPLSISTAQEQLLQSAREEALRAAERKAAVALEEARERADRHAEDCLLEPREKVERARAEWEAARAALPPIEETRERVRARGQLERLEREFRRRLAALRQTEEQRYAEKDRAQAELTSRAKVTLGRKLVASAYFWLG